MPNIEQPSQQERKPEIIINADKARKAMRQFWHREMNLETLKSELERKGEEHTKELLGIGREMEALRRTAKDQELTPPQDINQDYFVFASQNKMKHEMVAKSAEKQNMFLQETLFPPGEEDEEQKRQILKQLIQEEKAKKRHPHLATPTIRKYDPTFFAIDVAEAKASKMRETYKNQVIMAADIVVLQGNQILEKPQNRREALEILKSISGKEVKISLGVVLLTPTSFGKTVLLKEGAYFTLKLRNFSEEEAQQYLDQHDESYLNMVGVLDYADPSTQKLILDTPTKVEPLEFGRKAGEPSKTIFLSPSVLPQLKDYFMSTPRELIQELLKQSKTLRGAKNYS